MQISSQFGHIWRWSQKKIKNNYTFTFSLAILGRRQIEKPSTDLESASNFRSGISGRPEIPGGPDFPLIIATRGPEKPGLEHAR